MGFATIADPLSVRVATVPSDGALAIVAVGKLARDDTTHDLVGIVIVLDADLESLGSFDTLDDGGLGLVVTDDAVTSTILDRN